jgi:tRNA A-37 threonylcarbamoyl transferase component Bud32
MGSVHRVLDRARGHEVALKVLESANGRELYRFKREFRLLADIVHPNVVRLHELYTAGDSWMFTMELVEGVPFHRWVRPVDIEPEDDELTRPRAVVQSDRVAVPGRLDETRLRAALGQLADGLHALHATGKLHRDIKPSNILVDKNGRVVILDFGLVAELAQFKLDRTHENAAVGTPMYMSPEQAADLTLTEASDWYAVGIMLYEVLAGVRPFFGPPMQVLVAKQRETPPPPSQFAAHVPPDLERLCRQLLERDPRDRPTGAQVLQALGRQASASTERLRAASKPPPFVGRTSELSLLRHAFAASRVGPVVVSLTGPSGMGKSALVRAFLDEVGSSGAAVTLTGTCYERETVPFKVLDEVIDALTAHLVTQLDLERASLLPRDASALVRLFPVMKRVPGMPVTPGKLVLLDPVDVRRRGLNQLRELLAAVALAQPVVIVVDDLQWGDLDGVHALADLVTGPGAPRAPVIAVHRAVENDVLDAWYARLARGDREVKRMVIGELLQPDANQLWSALGGSGEVPISSVGGSPLLLGELAAAQGIGGGAASLEDVVRARVSRLGGQARALLQATALAARPMRASLLAAVLGDETDELALAALEGERLVRCHGSPELLVEPYHDRIREAVIADMGDDERRALHAQLASALDNDGAVDPEVAIQHWLAAGEVQRAARRAATAAAEAHQRLALHRAAALYELALRGTISDDERRALVTELAEVLAASGRLSEAAAAFEKAAALASGRERFTLERRRVEQLLRAGESEAGFAGGMKLLAAVGVSVPTTWRGTLASFLYQRLRIRMRGLDYTLRDEAAIDPAALDRLDVLWSLSSGFTLVDPMLGRVLQAKYLRDALDAGEPRRLASALALEVGYQAIPGLPARARFDAVVATTRTIAERVGDRARMGLFDGCSGIGAYLMGHYAEGRERLTRALDAMATDPAEMRWQIDVATFFLVTVLWNLGELRAMNELHDRVLDDAEERGDAYVQRAMRGWRGNASWLARGRVAEARANADRARSPRGPRDRFHLHHYYDLVCDTLLDLYEGKGDDAYLRIESVADDVAGFHLLRIQSIAIDFHGLRGAAAIAAGELVEAQRAEKALAKLDTPVSVAIAAQVRAGRLLAMGDKDGAETALRETIGAAAAAGLGVHLAVARWRLGTLRGGSAELDDARRWMEREGVADPEAFVRMMSPLPRG